MRNKQPGMTLIVKAVTRLTVGLILIYGVYVVLQGHIGPGGGFAGGVIIALSFIHLMLAFGKDAVLRKLDQKRGLFLSSLGGMVLLYVATLGFLGKLKISSSGDHFAIFGGSVIPLYDIAIALLAGTGLFVIYLALVLYTGESKS